MGGIADAAGGVLDSDIGWGAAPLYKLYDAEAGYLTNSIAGPKPVRPKQPGEDPRLAAIRERQFKNAGDYRANLPGIKEEAGNLAAEGIRSDTSQALKDVSKSYNRRGLLYSGLRAGDEGATIGSGASAIAKARADVNRASEMQADDLDKQALGQGYQAATAAFSPADVAQNAALRQSQSQAASQRAVGGAFGSVLGSYLGNRKKTPQRPSNELTDYDPNDNYSNTAASNYNDYAQA